MRILPQGRTESARLCSPSRSFAALALIAAVIAVNLTVPQAAQSQIDSKIIRVPGFSAPAPAPQKPAPKKPALPKAPVQVQMPPPPPMRHVPGMEEALVATGEVTDQESRDLDAALAAFHDAPAKAGPGGDYDDYARPLLAFIAAHPQSNWNAALELNIGLGYYHAGYYSRAFAAFENAWRLGRNATSPQAHIMIDRAVGELAEMHARVGHGPELEALFADIGPRPIGGPATELLQGARTGLWSFNRDPGIAYLCGPQALKNVLTALGGSKKQIAVADAARSGPHGFSLEQLAALADKAKLHYTLIKREPGQPIPVPSVVNWNVHHYAAIIRKEDGAYVVQDPTFGGGGGLILQGKAIDAETSGYFLVPASVIAANPKSGWRVVARHSAEAQAVYGMGVVSGHWGGMCIKCTNDRLGSLFRPIPRSPLTSASAYTSAVTLHMEDTPVGYQPQVGDVSAFTQIAYNQREDQQPANFNFSNLSSKWSHSWMRAVIDDPTIPGSGVSRVTGGGGGVVYLAASYSYNVSTGTFIPESYDQSVLSRTPFRGTATSYTRQLADGSTELYNQSNGAATYPRYMFLTKITDPRGNITTLNYDSQNRITSVVDPMGRSTTFTYGLPGFPLIITQITDGFGRASQMTYDASARLASITDPVGITSAYTYSPTETTFVASLTTPYGTSSFNDTLNPNDPSYPDTRSLTLTDPLGYTDFLYFYQAPLIPDMDPPSTVPTGMSTTNDFLHYRNTYYWNRHAWAACVAAGGCSISGGVPQSEDVTKSFITHFTHVIHQATPLASDDVESVKPPLEHRTWFDYEGQGSSIYSGAYYTPTAQGRVLDDGSSQVSKATYNPFGFPATQTDPLHRETQYGYDMGNNIDLLTVAQLTSPGTFTTIATLGSYTTTHRPQSYTDAAGQNWALAWTAAGQIHTVTDPNSKVTTWNYDSIGRLSNIVNANNQTQVSYTYDSADRIQTRTDSEGYTLTYAYDAIDRVTSITYPDGTTDLYDYTFQSGPYMGTASLELRKHTDRLGRVTTYGYDADRRLTSVTEPTQGTGTRTTSYDYYEDGTLRDIIDANNNDTRWAIDLESRPVSKTYAYGTPQAQTETYAYETTTSRLSSVTDALSQVKTFTYAEDDRVLGLTYTFTMNATPNVTFAWDPYFPRLISMADGTGTTNYSYTPIGTNGALKLSSIAGPFGNDTMGLTYDALGRLAGRNIPGGNETFGYDAISRLTSHVSPLGNATYSYLGQTEQTTQRRVINGTILTVTTNWGYDTNTNDRRLLSIANSGVSRSYTLGYGTSPVNVYDIMSATDTAAPGHPWATQSRAYTYDLIDRLLTASATVPGNDTYGYDGLDNATTYNTPATGNLSPTYNGLNQLATFGTQTYSYDANGNTLSGDGVKTYKWDAENRLIEIDYTGTGNKSVFTYDGVGHRTVDAETVGSTTTTTRYMWCGSRICQTRSGTDLVLRRDLDEGEYNPVSSIDQKLIYMPDQLGSVRDVIDATTGNLLQSYDYTPYGAVARSTGSSRTDYQYAGLFAHPQSGLNLAAFRAIDGVTGRWLNRDPIREVGGINLYAYVKADPVNRLDEEGLTFTLPPVTAAKGTVSPLNPLNVSPSESDPKSLLPSQPPLSSSTSNNSCSSKGESSPIVLAGDVLTLPIGPLGCDQALNLCKQGGHTSFSCLSAWARCKQGLGPVTFPSGHIGSE